MGDTTLAPFFSPFFPPFFSSLFFLPFFSLFFSPFFPPFFLFSLFILLCPFGRGNFWWCSLVIRLRARCAARAFVYTLQELGPFVCSSPAMVLRVFPFTVDNFLQSSSSKLKVILDYWIPCYVVHDVLQVCIVMHRIIGYGRA